MRYTSSTSTPQLRQDPCPTECGTPTRKREQGVHSHSLWCWNRA